MESHQPHSCNHAAVAGRGPAMLVSHAPSTKWPRMNETFQAIVASKNDDGRVSGSLQTLSMPDLGDEAVLVDVAYSTLNYKDGLAVCGKGICRKTPLVCGIDLAGTVVESADQRWRAGDRVLVNGFGLSEVHGGGYTQFQRVNPEFLVRVPDAYSLEQSMAIGTAGYTAMLCVLAIQDHGVTPDDGAILVTGAAGGVGSIAVTLLARAGYNVTAATGRPEQKPYFESLGASNIITREELQREGKPLEKEMWAAAVDCVGSKTLATVLAQTRYEGIVAACGLAAGPDLPATVLPFILRGVTLRGIDSVQANLSRRTRAWQALAASLNTEDLAGVYTVEPLAKVPELARAILAGHVRGRVVIDVNA